MMTMVDELCCRGGFVGVTFIGGVFVGGTLIAGALVGGDVVGGAFIDGTIIGTIIGYCTVVHGQYRVWWMW